MTENTPSPDKTGTHDAKKSFKPEGRRFRYDDRRYIDRGQLWSLQINQEILTRDVEKLNSGKVGHPYVFSNACFAAAFLFRNATGIRYRQLQGLAETVVGKENSPTYSAFQKRIAKLGCTFDEKGAGNTTSVWFSDGGARTEISLFAFDSTGLKPTNRGDWMTAKWGTRRGFIKMHVGVDAKTKKIYAVAITDDRCGDSPQFEELVEQAFANAEKSPSADTSAGTRVAADGAYDTRKIHRYCDDRGISPLIPVRINFAGKAKGCMPRKKAGFEQLGGMDHIDKTAEREFAGLSREQKREFQKAWREESGYNQRWSAEITFSTFKRVLGECISARKWENVKAEIYGKVQLYNQMIDTAIDNGYGTPRIVQVYRPESRTAGDGGDARRRHRQYCTDGCFWFIIRKQSSPDPQATGNFIRRKEQHVT